MNNIVAKKIIQGFLLVFILSIIIFPSYFVLAQQQCDCVCQNGNNEGPQSSQTVCENLCQQAYTVSGVCTPITNNNGNQNNQPSDTPKAQLQNPLGSVVTIPQIVSKIIKLIMGLVGIISLVMFIYAGFLWLTAQGKPDAVKKGRDTMLWAVVGLVVIFSSYIILNYIFKVLTF